MSEQLKPDKAPNRVRGETHLAVAGQALLLRPTFEALVAAEEELGSLFALVERAADGSLTIAEMAALVWHCTPAEGRPDRSTVGTALIEMGLAKATEPVRAILSQVVRGAA